MTIVREFHEQTGLPVADTPTNQPPDTIRLRMRLIREEYEEVMAELQQLIPPTARGRINPRLDVLARVLKELADLRYVLEGAAVELGLPINEAFEAVHASNMSKRWPDGTFHKDVGGKIIKPPSYSSPDMSRFVPQIIDEPDAHDVQTRRVGNVEIIADEGVNLK